MSKKHLENLLERTLRSIEEKSISEIFFYKKAYHNELVTLLNSSLDQNALWSLEQFLFFVEAFLFWPRLESKRIVEQIGPFLRNQGRPFKTKTLTVTDVAKAVEETLCDYSWRLKAYKLELNDKKITTSKQPMKWVSLWGEILLELKHEQQTLLDADLIIKCSHYRDNYGNKLNYELVKTGKPRPRTKNITQAALFLSEQLGELISKENVLELCVEYKQFRGYIKRDLFEYNKHHNHLTTQTETIDRAIENSLLPTYPYHYEGLICLLYDCNDQDPFIKDKTLKYLRDGGKIIISERTSIVLPFQLALSECILNIISCLTPKNLADQVVITDDNLLFIEEELLEFSKQLIKHAPKKFTSTESINDSQLLCRKSIKESYHGGAKSLSARGWKKIFEKEKINHFGRCRSDYKQNQKIYYFEDKVESWLVQEGYFTWVEIQKKKSKPQNTFSKSWGNALEDR